MTAQMHEIIRYKEENLSMASTPFDPYLKAKDIQLTPPHTACWRGYFGKWEIKDNQLFLTELTAFLNEVGEEVDLNYFFPSQNEVFADWFTGTLRIPSGEELEYVHMGFESIYERNILLEIKDGILVGESVQENDPADQQLSEEEFIEFQNHLDFLNQGIKEALKKNK